VPYRQFTARDGQVESQSSTGRFRTDLPVDCIAEYDPAVTAVLPALACAFAASCVWLTVRIINRRERWAKCAGAGLVLLALVGYPLSIGPAAIWATEHRVAAADFTRFYSPLRAVANEFVLLDEFLDWYTDLCWICWAAFAATD
jgi:hypothetical protein